MYATTGAHMQVNERTELLQSTFAFYFYTVNNNCFISFFHSFSFNLLPWDSRRSLFNWISHFFVSFANKKFEGYHIEIQSLLIYILEQCCRTCISCICKLFVFISSQMYCDFFNEFRRSRNFVIFFQKKKLRFNLKNFLDQPDLL